MKIEKLKETIMAEYVREWNEVRKKYPFVYADFVLQDKRFVSESDRAIFFAETVLSDTAVAISQRLSQCFNNLYRDAGRAETDEEVISAFENFSNCWRGR